MELRYVHLSPEQSPPELTCGPFRALVVSDVTVTKEWRHRIAKWLVASGCLYVIAWGLECEDWHDSVDWAVLEEFDFGDIPDHKFVMTTWHAIEPLSEAMWFAGQCAFHPDVELGATVVLDVAPAAREAEIMDAFLASQETTTN